MSTNKQRCTWPGADELMIAYHDNEWGVPVSEVTSKNSVITHAKSKRKLTYGAIAAKAANTLLEIPSLFMAISTCEDSDSVLTHL